MLTLLAAVFALAQAPAVDDARQIRWQRSLDDALAVAALERKPLLVAINADGESASDRIVRERYRDLEWVAWTRSSVCVVGSVFRHTPRDHDDDGRRIPCPRLGEVTCGEHMALEPVLHERVLSGERIVLDGEEVARISPRHALVLPDGTKVWDLFLLFDLRDLDAKVRAAAETWPAARERPLGTPPDDRRHRARLAFEQHLAALPASQVVLLLRERMREALERGAPLDHAIVGELRPLLPRLDATIPETRAALFDLAATTGTCADLAWAIRERLVAPTGADRDATEASLLIPALFDLVGMDPGHRTFVLSEALLADTQTSRITRTALGPDLDDVKYLLVGQSFDVLAHCGSDATVAPQRGDRPQEALAPAADLEAELEQADEELSRTRGSSALEAKFGRAALRLARRRMQDGGSGVDMLLQDARFALERAAVLIHDESLTLDRARVANYLSQFEEQERLAALVIDPLGDGEWRIDERNREARMDRSTVEGYRWYGDATARLLGARSKGDPSVEAAAMLRGATALTLAAMSPEGDATDWLSLASFFGALGRGRERIELAYEGLRRFPAAPELRSELASACASVGHPELLVEKSEQLARELPSWAECAWYAGYALVLQAEARRRTLDSDGALVSYERGAEHFRRALELEPNFRDSSEHYLGMCALGRGFALLASDRRVEAAACAVEAAGVRPAAFAQRDGLELEGVDLIDTVLEWRAGGVSPVDPLAWLAELERADPGNAFYARSISDAQLREGLRAFGRGAQQEGGAYLDAALVAGRSAAAIDPSEANRRALAQAATVFAERLLRDEAPDLRRVASALAEAAPLVGIEAPAEATLERAALVERAAAIRARLGPARPVFRPGR